MLRLCAAFSLALAVPACGGGSSADAGAEKKADSGAAQGALPESCERSAQPSATSLGLKPDRFIKCLEILLDKMPVPAEAKPPLEKQADGTYAIEGFMSIAMQVEGDAIKSMDVLFFPELRDKHGMDPELMGQFAVLSIVFPSAGIEPSEGERIFKEVDAIGRKTNNPVIEYDKDGIALNASFMPISVRYRFSPKG
jgi:hypothetical protein